MIPAGTLATLRADFGGTIADYAVSNVGGALRLAAGTLTMWDSPTGGAQHTDLVLGGDSVDSIHVGFDGEIPVFQGPPGVYRMWADGGGHRRLINSADYAADYAADAGESATQAQEAAAAALSVGATNDSIIAGRIAAPGSATQIAGDARWGSATARGVRPEGFNPTAGTGGDDSAAVQACIDTGFPILLTQGKTYLAHGLVAKSGMYITNGALLPGLAYQASLKTTSGDLFTTPSGGTAFCQVFRFVNVVLESAVGGGSLLRGMWSVGSFSNTVFVQNNDAKSCFDVTGWIDVSFAGACQMQHTTTSTVPGFKAVTSTGNLAQFDFGNTRITNSGTWFFHIEGTNGTVPINIGFENVNFEVCNGGAAKLLSCRNVKFNRVGFWDFSTAAPNHLVYIGKSATSGAAPRAITFESVIRDASTAPAGGVYDIFVDPAAGMTELNIFECSHQLAGNFKVSAGNSNGRIRGYGVTTLDAGLFMSTDFWQAVVGTLGGAGTSVGNGTVTARVRRDGIDVHYRLRFTLGTSSTIGSTFIVNLPINESAAGAGLKAIRVVATDSGSNIYILDAILLTATTLQVIIPGTNGQVAAVTTTAPFSFGNLDSLEVAALYEGVAA